MVDMLLANAERLIDILDNTPAPQMAAVARALVAEVERLRTIAAAVGQWYETDGAETEAAESLANVYLDYEDYCAGQPRTEGEGRG